MINPGLRNPIWLGILALSLIWPSGCCVEAIQFSYIGFEGHFTGQSDIVDSGLWSSDITHNSLFLIPSYVGEGVAGRLLYYQPVRMKDPQTRTATSFNCSFIFQILVGDIYSGRTGSGLTFMMVPDNSTVGAPEGYMGLLSTNTSENAHTLGVEFDTHMNPEFNDPNDNHIGIDLASMNSTATFNPPFRLAQNRSGVYHQVWIEYAQTLDIYIAEYGQGKPMKPFSTSVDMSSLLNEYMYVGFSAAADEGVDNLHSIFAWSFSTEGPAPNITIDHYSTLSSGSSAKVRYLLALKIGITVGTIVAICIGIIAILCCIYNRPACLNTDQPVRPNTDQPIRPNTDQLIRPNTDQPIRFYLAHAGEHKNFTEQLYEDLKSTWSYKQNRIKVFFDRHSMPWGEDFTENIKRALNRTQVGVVIVSREFFERPWPMTELVYLVRSKRRNESGVRILPLFYRLSVREVRSMVRAGTWDGVWSEMASPRHRHPLDAGECRAAVESLCNQHGVSYVYAEQGNDARYRQDVLKAVDEICTQMQEQQSSRNFGG